LTERTTFIREEVNLGLQTKRKKHLL